MRHRGRGFTLVELLVVVAIIGVMVGLLFPAISGAMNSLAEIRCQNNLSQLAKVIAAYCQQFNGSFPLGAGQLGTQSSSSASDWLYLTDSGGQPSFGGLLVRHKYIGSEDIFYCPMDMDHGLQREGTAVRKPPTAGQKTGEGDPPASFSINASITYGDYEWPGVTDKRYKVRSRGFGEFDPTDYLFIEQSSGVAPEPTSAFDTGYMTPSASKYALTNRHRNGGFVATMDGHVEWFHTDDFRAGMEKVGGGTDWYKKVLKRPEGDTSPKVLPEEIGAGWNPG